MYNWFGYSNLKKENERLKQEIKNHNALAQKEGVSFTAAKLQIIENDYKQCARDRDEYKHQLEAANKEIDQLKRWKREQLTVQSWWQNVANYLLNHKEATIGDWLHNVCMKFLKERDEFKKEVEKLNVVNTALYKVIEGGKKTIEEQNLQIKKLKKDIIANTPEITEAINELKVQKYSECNHCGYKIAYNMNESGHCDCCSDGMMIEKQEYCGYPLHWGGYSK